MHNAGSPLPMRDASLQTIHLKEYSPPAYLISDIALEVDIVPGRATVRATSKVARHPARRSQSEPLVLQGENLELVAVLLDGKPLPPAAYRVDDRQLVIASVPDAFTLETVVRFDPWKNTRLEGLYATNTGPIDEVGDVAEALRLALRDEPGILE